MNTRTFSYLTKCVPGPKNHSGVLSLFSLKYTLNTNILKKNKKYTSHNARVQRTIIFLLDLITTYKFVYTLGNYIVH